VAEWAGLRVGYLNKDSGTGEGAGEWWVEWEGEKQDSKLQPDPADWLPHVIGDPMACDDESGHEDHLRAHINAIRKQPDPDGWIPHVPGDSIPCDGDAVVDVKFNCGKVNAGLVASSWGWLAGDCDYNIAAWRPHQSQPKQPYSSDERAEWDVDAQHPNPEYTDAPYDAIDIKFHPNDPKGAAGAKKAPMHLLPPLPLMRLAWAMGHGAAKYGVNNFLDTKVLASTYIGAIGRHWAQFSSGEDNDNESGLSHIALLAANCMILMAAADAGTLIDDRRKQ
jgi:hypothetical protein